MFLDWSTKHNDVRPEQNGRTLSRKGKVPCHLWYGSKLETKYLKTFDATVYIYVLKQRTKKLDIKSQKGIFIGYDEN